MIELYEDNFTLYKPDKQFYLRSLEEKHLTMFHKLIKE
jgi:hypothetical protein